MKKRRPIFVCTILILFCTPSLFAQKNAVPENYYDSIIDALNLSGREFYSDAIRKLESVPRYDSLYLYAKFELGGVYMEKREFEKALDIFQELIQKDMIPGNLAYNRLAMVYDSLGNKEKALEIFNAGLELYPHNYIMYYNKAYLLQNMERYQEAITEYQKAIFYAPFHSLPHMRLGEIAAEEGDYTRAMLSLMYAFLMSTNLSQRADLIGYMEKLADLEIEVQKKNVSFGHDKLFTQINLIFERKIALNKNVKDQTGMDWSLTRQFQMICDALVKDKMYSEDIHDFWMQMYVPIFTDIYSRKVYAGMFTYCIQDFQVKFVQQIVKKNKKQLANFRTWIQNRYSLYKDHRYFYHDGAWQKFSFYYNPNNTVNGYGLQNEKGQLVGVWKFLHSNGRLRSTGNYSDGKRDGKWVWYYEHNGAVEDRTLYKDGKFEGQSISYREDGTVFQINTYENHDLHGPMIRFYPSGDTIMYSMYNKGKRNGDYRAYHPNGTVRVHANLVDDKVEGVLTVYYPDGSVRSKENQVAGELEGEYVAYFFNGQIDEKSHYEKGKSNGNYVSYYENGVVHLQGVFKNHVAVGSWEGYYYNGVKETEIEYDDKGKINAIRKQYDITGNLFLQDEFKNGEHLRITHFNKSGAEIYSERKRGSVLKYAFYLSDGTLKTQGDLVNDEKNGTWNYYGTYGEITLTEQYNNGLLKDLAVRYHSNGSIKSTQHYNKDGMSHGVYLEYYLHGELYQEGYYDNGNKTGTWYEYYPDGTLKSISYFANNNRVYYATYAPNGKLGIEYYYSGDDIVEYISYDSTEVRSQTITVFHGEVTIYNSISKKKSAILNYKNGELCGAAQWLNPTGAVRSTGSYLNGKRNGVWYWYAPNGVLQTQREYLFGEQHGQAFLYYTGTETYRYTEAHEYDIQHGPEIVYHPNGKVHIEREYVVGQIHGTVMYYSEAGNVYQIRYFDNGKMIGYSYLGQDGNPLEMISYTGTGKAVFYYQNGQKSLEWDREHYELVGEFIRYAEDGTVMEYEQYENHQRHGIVNRMYSPTNKWYEYVYVNGVMEGIQKIYHPNGNIRLISEYRNGNKHGVEEVFDTRGRKTHVRSYYDDLLVSERRL